MIKSTKSKNLVLSCLFIYMYAKSPNENKDGFISLNQISPIQSSPVNKYFVHYHLVLTTLFSV